MPVEDKENEGMYINHGVMEKMPSQQRPFQGALETKNLKTSPSTTPPPVDFVDHSSDSDECEFRVNAIQMGDNATAVVVKQQKPHEKEREEPDDSSFPPERSLPLILADDDGTLPSAMSEKTPRRRTSVNRSRRSKVISTPCTPSFTSVIPSSTPAAVASFRLTPSVTISSMCMDKKGTFVVAGCTNGQVCLYPLLSPFTAKYPQGVVLGQIEARGMYTSLMTQVHLSQDQLYVFAGVYRGCTEMMVFSLKNLDFANLSIETHREASDHLSMPYAQLESFTHSDAKLKGFGAVQHIPKTWGETEKQEYLLLCGLGIKNIHLWKVTIAASSSSSSSPATTWECLFDKSTNGVTVEFISFRDGGQRFVSKSQDQNIRVWDFNASLESIEAANLLTFHDIPNTQDTLRVFGDFAYAGKDRLALVDMSTGLRTELDLPEADASTENHSNGYSSKHVGNYRSVTPSRRKRCMRNLVQVASTASCKASLLLCSDKSVLLHECTEQLGIHNPMRQLCCIEDDPSSVLIQLLNVEKKECPNHPPLAHHPLRGEIRMDIQEAVHDELDNVDGMSGSSIVAIADSTRLQVGPWLSVFSSCSSSSSLEMQDEECTTPWKTPNLNHQKNQKNHHPSSSSNNTSSSSDPKRLLRYQPTPQSSRRTRTSPLSATQSSTNSCARTSSNSNSNSNSSSSSSSSSMTKKKRIQSVASSRSCSSTGAKKQKKKMESHSQRPSFLDSPQPFKKLELVDNMSATIPTATTALATATTTTAMADQLRMNSSTFVATETPTHLLHECSSDAPAQWQSPSHLLSLSQKKNKNKNNKAEEAEAKAKPILFSTTLNKDPAGDDFVMVAKPDAVAFSSSSTFPLHAGLSFMEEEDGKDKENDSMMIAKSFEVASEKASVAVVSARVVALEDDLKSSFAKSLLNLMHDDTSLMQIDDDVQDDDQDDDQDDVEITTITSMTNDATTSRIPVGEQEDLGAVKAMKLLPQEEEEEEQGMEKKGESPASVVKMNVKSKEDDDDDEQRNVQGWEKPTQAMKPLPLPSSSFDDLPKTELDKTEFDKVQEENAIQNDLLLHWEKEVSLLAPSEGTDELLAQQIAERLTFQQRLKVEYQRFQANFVSALEREKAKVVVHLPFVLGGDPSSKNSLWKKRKVLANYHASKITVKEKQKALRQERRRKEALERLVMRYKQLLAELLQRHTVEAAALQARQNWARLLLHGGTRTAGAAASGSGSSSVPAGSGSVSRSIAFPPAPAVPVAFPYLDLFRPAVGVSAAAVDW